LGIALGDFNMIPLSLAHQLLTSHGAAIDTWRVLHPQSSIGAAEDSVEMARNVSMPSAEYNVLENGATCDSAFNSWRWNQGQRDALKKGREVHIDPQVEDPKAKRLDYIFVGGTKEYWKVKDAKVGMIDRHPDLKVSLSDHFSVEVTLQRDPLASEKLQVVAGEDESLPQDIYRSILAMTDKYIRRERKQRRLRLSHFGLELVISIGCLVAVWWSPRNFVAFLLMVVSTIGLSAGVVDGLIGGIFVSWELRSLKEFRWEIENARELARQGGEESKDVK
jgi:sphingomyelin phosphodiesterase 2